jgi:hypothetical protein
MSQQQPTTDQMAMLACTIGTTALPRRPTTSRIVAIFAFLEFLTLGTSFWLQLYSQKVRALGDNPSDFRFLRNPLIHLFIHSFISLTGHLYRWLAALILELLYKCPSLLQILSHIHLSQWSTNLCVYIDRWVPLQLVLAVS